MLNGYFGNTGSGKSYSVVEYVVIPSLKDGRHVYTNIPLERDLLTSVYGGEITQLPLDWHENPLFAEEVPNGCVLILDEVWRKWPAGQTVRQVPVVEMALLKEHRHRVDAEGRAMRVVLVSQFPGDIATWARKLIDVSYFMSKLDGLGANNHFHVDVVKGCPAGDKIPKKSIIQTRKGTYKQEIYQFYRSATNSETFTVGDESVSDRRGNLWTSKWLWFCIAFGLIAVIGGPIYIISGFFGGYVKEQPKAVRAPVPAVQLVNPAPGETLADIQPPAAPQQHQVNPPPGEYQQPINPGEPPRSSFWRVGGYIDVWDKEDAAIKHPAVILVGPANERRLIAIDTCQREKSHLSQGRSIYVFCDVDGERVTFWSGRTNVTNVLDGLPMAKDVGDAVSEPRERSAPPTAAAQAPAPGPSFNVVPDSSRMPRTLLGSNP